MRSAKDAYDDIIKDLGQASHQAAQLFDGKAQAVHAAWKSALKETAAQYTKGAFLGTFSSRGKAILFEQKRAEEWK